MDGRASFTGMAAKSKSDQLQIRVSAAEKAAIQRAARAAGLPMSEYVLKRLLPDFGVRFNALTDQLACARQPAFALAALNDLLATCSAEELADTAGAPPSGALSPFHQNYVAAMVEMAAARLGVAPPAWAQQVRPLEQPWFGTDIESLRLYLLAHAPAPFRRRNIFIDSTLGNRV